MNNQPKNPQTPDGDDGDSEEGPRSFYYEQGESSNQPAKLTEHFKQACERATEGSGPRSWYYTGKEKPIEGPRSFYYEGDDEGNPRGWYYQEEKTPETAKSVKEYLETHGVDSDKVKRNQPVPASNEWGKESYVYVSPVLVKSDGWLWNVSEYDEKVDEKSEYYIWNDKPGM